MAPRLFPPIQLYDVHIQGEGGHALERAPEVIRPTREGREL